MPKRSWECQYYTIENSMKKCNFCARPFPIIEPIESLRQHIIDYHPNEETEQLETTSRTTRWTKSN